MSHGIAEPLKTRIQAFLKQPVPEESGPVSGSMAEAFLAAYVKKGARSFDEETAEMIELCIADSETLAEEGGPAQRAYFKENAALLTALLHEIQGAQ